MFFSDDSSPLESLSSLAFAVESLKTAKVGIYGRLPYSAHWSNANAASVIVILLEKFLQFLVATFMLFELPKSMEEEDCAGLLLLISKRLKKNCGLLI